MSTNLLIINGWLKQDDKHYTESNGKLRFDCCRILDTLAPLQLIKQSLRYAGRLDAGDSALLSFGARTARKAVGCEQSPGTDSRFASSGSRSREY